MKKKVPFRKNKWLLDFARDEMEMYWSAFKSEVEFKTDAKLGDDPIDKLLHYLIVKGVFDDEAE